MSRPELDLRCPALRMNARNLRAKVRSMLPLDICCKYEHRNSLLSKLQNRRRAWQKKESLKHTAHRWQTSNNRDPTWFHENFEQLDMKTMFAKLTPDEIQQICNDKHYYLGEAHFHEFEEFLAPRPTAAHKQSNTNSPVGQLFATNIGFDSATASPNQLGTNTSKHNSHADGFRSTTAGFEVRTCASAFMKIASQKPSSAPKQPFSTRGFLESTPKSYNEQQQQSYRQNQKKRRLEVALRIRNIQENEENKKSIKKLMLERRLKTAENNLAQCESQRGLMIQKRRQREAQNHQRAESQKKMRLENKEIASLASELKKLCTFKKPVL